MVSSRMKAIWLAAALAAGASGSATGSASAQSATPPTANPVTHAVGANPEVNGQALTQTGAGLSSDAKTTPATGAYDPKTVGKGGVPSGK